MKPKFISAVAVVLTVLGCFAAGAVPGQAAGLEKLKTSSADMTKGVDFTIDINVQGPYPPLPYTPYPSQPNYPQRQTVFKNGEFRFASDSEKSMDYAVSSLKNKHIIDACITNVLILWAGGQPKHPPRRNRNQLACTPSERAS